MTAKLASPLKSYTVNDNLHGLARGAVIALGNFDGLHRGHRAVIARAKTIADKTGAPLGVASFDPHPIRFFRPDAPPFRLMSPALRAQILPELGVSRFYHIPFNAALKALDDAEFVNQILFEKMGISHVLVGEEFRFGKDRCGDVESLTKLCKKHGIGVTPLKAVGLHKFYGKYGSTQIREAIRAGDVFHAAHMLGRPYIVDGEVTKGAQRGRTIGFPTANIGFANLTRPLFGVYAVEVKIDGEDNWHPGVANTGSRPTVGGTEERVEVHIFDFNRDIYGKNVQVAFRSFIRPEQKFDSFEVLAAQIKKDANGARAVFGLNPNSGEPEDDQGHH